MRNDQVPVDALPAVEKVALLPVSSRYASYRTWSAVIMAIPPLLLVVALPVGWGLETVWHAALLVFAVMLALGLMVLSRAEARRRAYALREEDLIHRQGLLVERTTIIPLCRIQHVETATGPLERLFGLVRLTCFTAGGASADLVIAGLDTESADRLRQHLVQRMNGQAPDFGR
ncbi:membrane protein YdbS with pleckstrin-like domain [Natronocella acetinitrilica]|uniref:Membrane protein YdbS with pleckstrin-like domain n=1 Tax=Natronocella acetinitrilica TaxID=414046 RepID=A0AAE3G631_9GAMM|nr:PH domain-containing protein [Natronocella acetinitrilica]MCP1675773.1 membrane protein YdbS with pleckstrin-like domain [Natronocella acetinitrilica]